MSDNSAKGWQEVEDSLHEEIHSDSNYSISESESIFESDSIEPIQLEPLSTIEPLLELLDRSLDYDAPDSLAEAKFSDEEVMSKAQASQESLPMIYHKGKGDGMAHSKRSFENILKNVGSKVKKQLSLTSFTKKTPTNNIEIASRLGSSFSTSHVLSLPKTYPKAPHTDTIAADWTDSEHDFHTRVMPFDWDPDKHIDNAFLNQVQITRFTEETESSSKNGFLMNIPEQSSPEPEIISGTDHSKRSPIVYAIDQEYAKIKSKNSKEWDQAVLSYEISGDKDFRRIFSYINGKIEMPSRKILCLAYSPKGNVLIIGGQSGMLKLIEVVNSPNFIRTENPDVTDVAYEVLRHVNLKGHLHDVEHLTWHNSGERFTTSDSQGVIIGWINRNGSWIQEMVQGRNSSNVLGISWSPKSTRVCLMYQEINARQDLEYGIVMGLLNGRREWNIDFGSFAPSAITWLEETKFAIIFDNTVSIYHSNGQKMQKRCLVHEVPVDGSRSSKSERIVSFFCKQNKSWTATGTFSLAIVWEANRMMLLRDINDQSDVVIRTKLKASCAAWSPNGLFIAVGGKPLRVDNISQVNIFSYVGKHLTVINVNEPCMSSISWDSDSLHVAIGASNLLFFGKIRPVYKFASNGSLFAYAFTKDNINYVAFLVGDKVTINEVPGSIVDLQSHGERFALLVVSDQGIYTVSVINKLGVPLDVLCVLTMEPFAVRLSDTCLVCLSSNGILIWKYKFTTGLNDQGNQYKNVRQVHVDDSPGMMAAVNEGAKNFSTAVADPAVCMDAKRQYLCIARASGKLQFYHLPQGGIFYTMEVNKFNPRLLMFNPLADRLALLDMNGCLTFGTLSDSKVEIKRSKATKEVLNILWSKDMEYHLCVMERTQMYILRNAKIEERFHDISSLQGYLAGFNNLEVTLLKLDDILDNPDQPHPKHIMKVDLQIVSKIKSDLINGDVTKLDKLIEMAEKRNHPRLWTALGEGALARGKLGIAESAFVKGKNYGGLMLIKQIENMESAHLQRAEISCFLQDYDKAEEYYVKADRMDLAFKMWKHLGDHTRMELMTDIYSYNISEDLEYYTNVKLEELAEKYVQSRNFNAALVCYNKMMDYQKVFECHMILEDYKGLQAFSANLPKKSPILQQLASSLSTPTTEAVKAHLASGDPQGAVVTALDNFQWNLALEVSQAHQIPIDAPALLKHNGQLLNDKDIMEAVKLLERCDKKIAAGKLLTMVALKELREHLQPDLASIKKLFVMAAIMLTTKTKKFFKEGKLKTDSFIDDKISIKFEEFIPHEYRPSLEELKWIMDKPWRGAHAVHYLITAQLLLYRGHFDKATKAANYLWSFRDILGSERINCMIALASVNGNNYSICSKAFLELEPLDYEYTDLAADIFRDKENLIDQKTRTNQCPGCKSNLPNYHAACERSDCQASLPVCIITGNILPDDTYVWSCRTCGGTANARKVKRIKFCPLCHTTKFCDV